MVQSTAVLFSGQDLGTNDDGIFDSSLGITVIDGLHCLSIQKGLFTGPGSGL